MEQGTIKIGTRTLTPVEVTHELVHGAWIYRFTQRYTANGLEVFVKRTELRVSPLWSHGVIVQMPSLQEGQIEFKPACTVVSPYRWSSLESAVTELIK